MTEYDSNSTYRAKHGLVDLSKLQQSLSIKNRIVQPQQALQLNQTLISWRIFHCQWGVSGPVVSALDSGSKGSGSSPTRGMSLYP